MTHFPQPILDKSMSYAAYRQLIDDLVADGKTTGPVQNEAMLNYTQMNIKRMQRWDKTGKLISDAAAALARLKAPQYWLTTTEGWCGDASQIVPHIELLATAHPQVETRYLLRDEYPEVMDQFLTNGAKSIPITIILQQEDLKVLGHWGPRPAVMQARMLEAKAARLAEPDEERQKAMQAAWMTELHTWYAKDRGKTTQEDFLAYWASVVSIPFSS